ncbi:MAG: hypothetical protein NT080_05475 [Spirochaetes bacterium]|nr:hypothetical protein [Spirochaetota bacterium]
MASIVRERGGFIDKYPGDGFLALFPGGGVPTLDCAVEMRRALALLNAESGDEGFPAMGIGIGVHQGTLMLGTIGEAERMEPTSSRIS